MVSVFRSTCTCRDALTDAIITTGKAVGGLAVKRTEWGKTATKKKKLENVVSGGKREVATL